MTKNTFKEYKLYLIPGPGIEEIEKTAKNLGLDIRILSIEEIDEEKIIDEIRSIPPQIRGKIRYGKGKPLLLTRSGNLNTHNTTILLIYSNDRLLDIYPKRLGSRYFSVLDGLRKIVNEDIYLYEESLVQLLSQHPELIGCSSVVYRHYFF